MIIACLAADDALSEDQVSQITAMPSSREQCKMLYYLMKTSFQLYESFLNIMQTNDQIHVSNLLTGVNDDLHLPLSDSRYERLTRVKPKLMQIIHCDEILLSSLEAKTAISETDRQDVRVDVLTNYERNWAIINAIQRRSNASFVYFEESLRETHQVHAADYLTQGEVLAVHVNTNQPELDDELSQRFNDVIVHEDNREDRDYSSEGIFSELHINSIRPVASKPGHSIIVFLYCKTVDDMIEFTNVLKSGQLTSMFERALQRLLMVLERKSVGSLDVKLTLDNEEILLIEEITGVNVSDVWERLKNPPSWVEDKFHEQQKCDDRNVHTEARDKFSNFAEYFQPPALIKSLPSIGGKISGIIMFNDLIFVTRFNSTKIRIFNIFDFQEVGPIQTNLKRAFLSWPKQKKKATDGLNDVAACSVNACLYTSSRHDCRIVKVNPIFHKVSYSWVSHVGTPTGLSVTRTGNVIVCCPKECKVSEYTAIGHLLNTFDFGFTPEGPGHAIQLNGDRYIACYDRPDGRVSTVHCIGTIGLLAAKLNSIKLTNPCHIAVDSCDQVLIVERGCKRIILANPTLDRHIVLLDTDEGSPAPTRIFLSEATGRLLVGAEDGSFNVYNARVPKSMASAKNDSSWYYKPVHVDSDIDTRTLAGISEGFDHTFGIPMLFTMRRCISLFPIEA